MTVPLRRMVDGEHREQQCVVCLRIRGDPFRIVEQKETDGLFGHDDDGVNPVCERGLEVDWKCRILFLFER